MNRKAISSGFLRASLTMSTVLLLLFLCAPPLHAQVDTGTILGTVTDASGAAISGAKVTLTNEGTSAALSTTTAPDGSYKFTPVKIGSYKLTTSFQGFQTITQTNVVVNVGTDVVINFNLKPGAVTQTVEVVAAVPVLQTQNASVGQVVDSRSVNDLPLNGRNFTFLAQLSAGVNTPQADTRGNAANGAFAANGLRPAENNYLLDGIDNNSDTVDFLNGTNFVVLPPVDAIEEFKVETSGFSAQYGRSGAAVLNATIKSGTNELHGSAWEFFRNDKLDAADFFENAGGIKKGALRQNQFGVSAGGPILKNKVFIFGDYEGFRRVQGTVLTGSVPTALERSSGFTNLTELLTQGGTNTDNLGRVVPKGTVFDPSTTRSVTAGSVDPVTGLLAQKTGFARDPFSTCPKTTTDYTSAGCQSGLNLLPAGRLDANALSLLALYPNPTNSSLFGNFTTSPKLFEHKNAFDTRMDINMNEKNQVFFRFSYADDPQFIPGIFGGVADGGGFAQGNQTANAQQSALGYTHTFNPNLINVARAGLNYLHTTRNIPAANDLSNLPGKYGVLGIPQAHENGGLPAFGIGGLQTLGGNAFLPSDEVTSTLQLTDDLTKIYGKHTFKGGFEWQHVKFSTLQPPWSRGQFNFIPGGPPTNGPAYLIPSGKTDLTYLTSVDCTNPANATFLTCLLAKDGIALSIGKYSKSLGVGQKSNIAPRFGFAYQATPKLVVRSGFGIFFNGFENRGFSPNLGENYPFQFNFSFFDPDAGHAINNFAGCAKATPTGGPTFETGFSCTPLDPKLVNASGLALRGIQYNYLTPYSMGGNLSAQYQLTSSMSFQAAYVTTLARHLESFPGNNRPTSIQPNTVNATTLVPFPDFGRNSSQAQTEGSSYYHGLQTRIEKQFKGGLNFLASYTWSRTMSDAGDLLNGGSDYVGYRAPYVPGFGIQKDYKLANFDIRNVFHFSGGYELPFGKGKKFMSDGSGITDKIVGGWSTQWIATLQGGQPITFNCVNNTLQSVGCGALHTGQPLKVGLHNDSLGKLSWFNYDPALDPTGAASPLTNPATCAVGACTFANLGGITQAPGPGFHRLDFSIFKDFPFNEKRKLQFRTEIFNIFNHPNFNAPGFGGNGVVSIGGSTDWTNNNFGRIGSTRDAPYDPRQIQFALKLLF